VPRIKSSRALATTASASSPTTAAKSAAIANLPDYMQAAVSVPNGSAIIAGGEDSLLRVWDSAGKELVAFGAK
jgi:hypothetical protein